MFGIKKLDWLIIKSYIGPLIMTFCVTTFLLLMQFLWKYIDDLVGKGLEWSVIVELLFYASMGILQMSIPLAILCASIYIYGNLGENNELIAIKASGISLPRIMRPLIIVNIIVALMTFVYSNNVLPYSNLRLWSLMFDVRQQRPELNIKEGVFFDGIEKVRMKIGTKNKETNMMYDVMIYDHRNEYGNTNVTIADSASMNVTANEQYLLLTLYGGVRYEDVLDAKDKRSIREKRPFQRQIFSKQQVMFEIEGADFNRTNMDLFKHNSQMQNLSQLIYTVDSLNKKMATRNEGGFEHFFTRNIYKSNLEEQEKYQNIDSVFNSMQVAYQLQATARALNYARAAESYLQTNIVNTTEQNISLNKHRIEMHRKFNLVIACILMFFLGAPFGAIVRKGGLGVPVIFSFLFYLIYYITSMIGEKSVKSAEMAPAEGMWIASYIILAFGIYFTYMATNDRGISNPKLFIQRLLSIVKIKIKD